MLPALQCPHCLATAGLVFRTSRNPAVKARIRRFLSNRNHSSDFPWKGRQMWPSTYRRWSFYFILCGRRRIAKSNTNITNNKLFICSPEKDKRRQSRQELRISNSLGNVSVYSIIIWCFYFTNAWLVEFTNFTFSPCSIHN